MSAVFLDVEMEPGTLREVRVRRALLTRRPMFLFECPLNFRFRNVLVTSIRFVAERPSKPREDTEQLAIESGVPAELFAELPPSSWGPVAILPPLVAGDEVVIGFANPLGAPQAAFRVWFGELAELELMRKPRGCLESVDGHHAWRPEVGRFSRSSRCVRCSAVWVSKPL